RALSREVFISGAFHAVRWIAGKQPGMYTLDQVLDSR
ncbi:4-hydroxy-tetrahydrodipicolinate reductase, partial [bacterium]|nr:4-hydroxy-tetrahydrodipicolinate reductase [candidate division CSSED10-310 bacterium]